MAADAGRHWPRAPMPMPSVHERRRRIGLVAAGVPLGLRALALGCSAATTTRKPADAAAAAKPALTVTRDHAAGRRAGRRRWPPTATSRPGRRPAIGAEANGLRLAEVRVNVGDLVKRGQVLARLAGDDHGRRRRADARRLAEAEADAGRSAGNAERARELQATGAISAQQIKQYLTAEQTAQARVEAAQRAAASRPSCGWRRRACWRRTTA